MTESYDPYANAVAERVNGILKQEFLLDKLGGKAKSELYSFCDETDFLSKESVKQLFLENDSTRIWMLLNFAMWWNHFIKPSNK